MGGLWSLVTIINLIKKDKMKKAFFINFLLLGLISCGQTGKYKNLADTFLSRVKENDLEGARKMIKADLKDIAKDSEIFVTDMRTIQRLINKNGLPQKYKVDEFDHGVVLRSVEANLGGDGGDLVIGYVLQLYFIRGADQNGFSGYSLERILSAK
jgi:hypothetical protein